jgi:DNA repair exonuclease SbcCD ATPase subunit
MRILYIKLVNYIGIKAAMGLNEFELSFDSIDKPIIQIMGPNKCGKTVVTSELHPLSSVNLNGDDRSDLPLILKDEIGIKEIGYELKDGNIANITITHRPTGKSHSTSCSFVYNGEELNPSGGVGSFNDLVNKILGINKYSVQFIINKSNLVSFGSMSATQRKNLLNKAMNIDKYDKYHKHFTDEYRFTNKLITSLNNTREYLLSTFGSYEMLCKELVDCKTHSDGLFEKIQQSVSKMDYLSGRINLIQQQNPSNELHDVNNQLNSFYAITSELGNEYRAYDVLVNEQIELNQIISRLQSKRDGLNKDIDILYEKKEDIERTTQRNQQAIQDFQNMENAQIDLKRQIENITIQQHVNATSDYIKSLIQLAQTINSTCKEIVTSLNTQHLKMFTDLIKRNIDVSAFLLHENSILMDGEKEKAAIARIKNLSMNVNGAYPEECQNKDCLFRKSYDTLDTFFKSYQSTSSDKLTLFDLEQMDHAHKNIQVVRRLLNTQVPDEFQNMFMLDTILDNLCNGRLGMDIGFLERMLEEAGKIESRNRLIQQLSSVESSLQTMRNSLVSTNPEDGFSQLISEVERIQREIRLIDEEIEKQTQILKVNDRQRMLLSEIQHLDVKELTKRQRVLQKTVIDLNQWNMEYGQYQQSHSEFKHQFASVSSRLKTLEEADAQYKQTIIEIEKHNHSDAVSRAIAESTSPIKGKPVDSIRNKMYTALSLTNRLLDVLYSGEVKMLEPTIDDKFFVLPFRSDDGGIDKQDVRYGSQSETALLSLALQLSIASTLTNYNIPLIDEVDGPLDINKKDNFILMIQEIMATLKMEQLFIISHTTDPNLYPHLIHAIDISK